MPRLARAKKPHRLNLEMSDRTHAALLGLLEATDADSQAEVIRRALVVYEFVHGQVARGGEVVVRVDGRESKVHLL